MGSGAAVLRNGDCKGQGGRHLDDKAPIYSQTQWRRTVVHS